MTIAHYLHRLPSDYDLNIIRERALQRGPLWDAVPGLRFKAFLLGEKGLHGASGHSYSSLYLWDSAERVRDFLVEGRYQGVIDSYGRAPISTWLSLDAQLGAAAKARYAHIQARELAPAADLAASLAQARELNQARAAQPGVAASVVALDPQRWQLLEVLLAEHPQTGAGQVYEVLYLARPEW